MLFKSADMEFLESLGFGQDIDEFESYFGLLRDAAANGQPMVQDPVYDRCKKILEQVRPESQFLKGNWEEDGAEDLKDYDELLKEYGMRSIRTCTTDEEIMKNFGEALENGPIEVCTSFKLNGHACRVVYENGELVSATTRGRYKKGRDITRHLRTILGGHNEYLEAFGLVEIRGELIVTYNDFLDTLSAKSKTPLSSVTSLVRESATDEELKYLHFVAYKCIIKDNDFLESLSDELVYLRDLGFEVPHFEVRTVADLNDITHLREYFEHINLYKYDTDGIVMAVNNDADFYRMGLDGNAFKGNIAIKMGSWACNKYQSTIKEIVFERGKKWFTPKAIIEPVVTASGSTVTTVPIYNVGVMNNLKLIPGNEIYFRFGGETGVQLLTPQGLSVTEI